MWTMFVSTPLEPSVSDDLWTAQVGLLKAGSSWTNPVLLLAMLESSCYHRLLSLLNWTLTFRCTRFSDFRRL